MELVLSFRLLEGWSRLGAACFSFVGPPLVKEFECEVCVYDDFASMLADGFFDDAVFVCLGGLVTYAKELFDATETVDVVARRLHCGCCYSLVHDGSLDSVIKELYKFLY